MKQNMPRAPSALHRLKGPEEGDQLVLATLHPGAWRQARITEGVPCERRGGRVFAAMRFWLGRGIGIPRLHLSALTQLPGSLAGLVAWSLMSKSIHLSASQAAAEMLEGRLTLFAIPLSFPSKEVTPLLPASFPSCLAGISGV